MFKRGFKTDSTKIISFFYFFLLIYTIAALVWWGILLHQQNTEIVQLKIALLEQRQSEIPNSAIYQQMLANLKKENNLRDLQYLGEGGSFLLIILLSAGFVYRAMRRQIKLSRQQQNLLLAVTHELKSPIAILRLNVETLLKRKLPEDKQRHLLEKALSETDRLNRLSNNMLLSSRFENKQYEIEKRPLNFSKVVDEIAKDATDRVKNRTLSKQISPGLVVEGDVLMLQIVCSNLIENAQKYAPDRTEISICLSKKGSDAVLRIKDQGEGIPKEEKAKIFNRFYRIGNENTRKTKGTGLGLFLTKKILAQHQGDIVVKDNTPTGSIFEVTLPVVSATDIQKPK